MPKRKKTLADLPKTEGKNPPRVITEKTSSLKLKSKKEPNIVSSFQRQPQTMDELLAQTDYPVRGLKRGQLVEGEITYLSPHEVLIDVGAKSEGIVTDRNHSLVADFLKTAKVGDKVIAYVVNPEDESGQIILSLRKAGVDHKWKVLIEQKDKGEVVTVRGLEVNRGGLLVDYQGLRGFIPSSQLDISYTTKPQELINKSIQVKVLEVESKENRLIFSQKAVLSKEEEVKIKEKIAKIKAGETHEGKVTGITPFGLFVNADGIDGLVHISEIAWEKIEDPNQYFKVGDQVKVKVLEIDEKTGRVNLSIKQLTPDPYEKLNALYNQGKIIKGQVVRLINFGVFVKLEQGIEGLIHISKIPPGRELKVDEKVECLVESIDSKKRKISLSLVLKEKPVGYK